MNRKQRERIERRLTDYSVKPPPDFADAKWICRCLFPDGTLTSTFWLTQDAACEAESEAGQFRAVCVVYPLEES